MPSAQPRVPERRRAGIPGGAWVGLAGSALLGLAATSRLFSESPDGWPWPPVRALGEQLTGALTLAALFGGFILLTTGWWLVRPVRGRPEPSPWLLLGLWSLPLLVVPPVMSQDAFLYADLGWIQASGANPYDVGVGALPGPYTDHVDPLWIGSGVAYPPLALRAHAAAAWLAGFDPYWGMVAQRLLALVGVALIAVFLPRLAEATGGSRRWANWFAVLNPLLVLQYVGGAHNDALMAGIVVFALWVATLSFGRLSASLVVAPVLIGVAMGVKQQAGLAVVAAALLPVSAALAGLPPLRRLWVAGARLAAATAVAVTAFAVVSLASGLGFGWTRWLHVMGMATNDWLDLLEATGVGPVVAVAVPAAALGVIGWLLATRLHRPVRVTAYGSLLVALLGRIPHPWYLVLGIVLLGADQPPARVVNGLGLDLEPRPPGRGQGSSLTAPEVAAP